MCVGDRGKRVSAKGAARARRVVRGQVQAEWEDFDAILLVEAVKGRPLNLRQWAKGKISGRDVIINSQNGDRALDWFGEWAGPLVKAYGFGPKILVRIANTSAMRDGPPPRTALMPARC
jgi:hypothetical protein